MGEFPTAYAIKNKLYKSPIENTYIRSTKGGWKKKKEHQVIVSSHCTKGGLSISLTLKSWSWACCLKLCSHSRSIGLPLSQILAFLKFQISHVAIKKTSMNSGILDLLAVCPILSCILTATCQCILNLLQQDPAKGQEKNRCSISSSTADAHITRWALGWT